MHRCLGSLSGKRVNRDTHKCSEAMLQRHEDEHDQCPSGKGLNPHKSSEEDVLQQDEIENKNGRRKLHVSFAVFAKAEEEGVTL